MNWWAAILAGSLFAGATGGGLWASTQGWGLPGELKQPVSVREQSRKGAGQHRRSTYGYFSHRSRRHHRGGYHFGK
jgi:hypothetical protein